MECNNLCFHSEQHCEYLNTSFKGRDCIWIMKIIVKYLKTT